RVENLSILTAGPTPPNPSELIASAQFDEIYNELLNDYDFIVIDTPPVNTVTDAQVYAQTIRNCALVIDAEKNNKTEVKKAKDLINKAGGKLLGAILNKTAIDKSSSYYDYIVIDTPPANTVTDEHGYTQSIRNCERVIDAEKNNKNEVKKAKDLINKAGGKLLGAILNKTAIDKSSSYYYYYGDD